MGHLQDQWGATSISFVTETAAKSPFSCVNWVLIQIGWHKNISDMWRSNWKVDFHCSVIFTRVNGIETMYGRSRVNVKQRTLLNLYVYAWSFIQCRFIYARTRVKKKKKATVEINLYSHRWPLSQVYAYRGSIRYDVPTCRMHHSAFSNRSGLQLPVAVKVY